MKECHMAFLDWDSLTDIYNKEHIEFADSVCNADEEPDKWQRALSFHAAWTYPRTRQYPTTASTGQPDKPSAS